MRLPDGSLIFDAALKVRDLDSQYGITVPEDSSYETIGGFVLTHLGFLPRGGESFEANGYLFTVMDMERRRVSRVKIKQVAVPAPPAPESKSATEPAKPAKEANAVAAAASETAPPETVAPARARRATRRSRS